MLDSTVLSIIVSVLALCIGGYALWRVSRAGTPITGALLTAEAVKATTTATELAEVALTAVQASEQLWRVGKIERGERLDKAFSYVKRWFPQLDQATIVTALEASVLVVNALVASLPDAPPKSSGEPTLSAQRDAVERK